MFERITSSLQTPFSTYNNGGLFHEMCSTSFDIGFQLLVLRACDMLTKNQTKEMLLDHDTHLGLVV